MGVQKTDHRHPFLILAHLGEPPSSWLNVRMREDHLKRRFRLNELRALVAYHAYGFECQKNFATKQHYINLLNKILYYTQSGLGNNTAFTKRSILCAGPVGPGTLPDHIRIPRGLPNWYLDEQAALQKIQLHQSVRLERIHPKDMPEPDTVCYHIAPETPSYSYSNAIANIQPAHDQQKSSSVDVIPSRLSPDPVPPSSTEERSVLTGETEAVVGSGDDYDEDENKDKNSEWGEDASKGDGDRGDPPEVVEVTSIPGEKNDAETLLWHTTAESIRKAIVAPAYSGLQLVSDAFWHAEPFLLATKNPDLVRKLTENKIASSHISIRFSADAKYTIDEEGCSFSYYGRGPEWSNNSCYWDSIIVSCLFLNTGFTHLDRGVSPEKWENEFSPVQRAFLDVLRMDWSFFDTKTSIAQKDMFLKLFHQEFEQTGSGPKVTTKSNFDSPAARWNDIAGPFKQFSFRFHQRRQYCPCQKRPVHNNLAADTGYVTPPYQASDAGGVRLAVLLERWSSYIIPHCESGFRATRTIIHGELPLRLALQITAGTQLSEHTFQNLSFSHTRICPESGNESKDQVTYKWLGGVYCSGAHFRVYWNDSPSGARTVNRLRVYDGMEACGAIIGNVVPSSETQPIPDTWMSHTPPLLFYERVIGPSTLALQAAQSAIANLAATHSDRRIFPHNFSLAPSVGGETNLSADALLPRELSGAILTVEGPMPGFHSKPYRPKLTRNTAPQASPSRSKRHTSRPRLQNSSTPSSTESQKRVKSEGNSSPSSGDSHESAEELKASPKRRKLRNRKPMRI